MALTGLFVGYHIPVLDERYGQAVASVNKAETKIRCAVYDVRNLMAQNIDQLIPSNR